MANSLRFFGMSGSLRKNSYNTAALHAAKELLPPDVTLDIFDLSAIPLYNEDLREQGFPESAQQLRDGIAAADAVLIATPEYNYSVSGVLKNAVDWASRPPDQPFNGKPIAIMGASPGMLGTARAQYHLRQSFVFLNGMVLNQPEVMISMANTKFDAQGKLTDEKTREFIQKLLASLAQWSRRLQGST
jgi:chromate reductase